MKKIFFFLKNILVYIITLVTFGVASKVIEGTGNMPLFMVNAYGDSIFAKTGTETLAILGLCSIIVCLLLVNFNFIKDGIHKNMILKGLIYGASFGILWFFGFTEMNTINNDNVSSHLFSGLRDFLVLSVFGLIAGAILCKTDNARIKRDVGSFMAIPFTALTFAVFHGTQLCFTFRKVSAYQKIDDFVDVIWLIGFGAWIGVMYYFFRPGIKFRNKYLCTLFFSYIIFGSDWFLFNLFYNIFLNIPLIDLFLRCFTGCTGVFIGLSIHELLLNKKVYGGK